MAFHRAAAIDPSRSPAQRAFHLRAAKECARIIRRAGEPRGAFNVAFEWTEFCNRWRAQLEQMAHELRRARARPRLT